MTLVSIIITTTSNGHNNNSKKKMSKANFRNQKTLWLGDHYVLDLANISHSRNKHTQEQGNLCSRNKVG